MPRREIRCAVLTISDRASEGVYEDRSGPEIARILEAWGWSVSHREVLRDEETEIAAAISRLADSGTPLIVTTGGTGLGPRDRTPEATLRICDRIVPGLAELARSRTGARTSRAFLSRGIAAMRGQSLILNLPGSPQGATEMLSALADVLPHALDVAAEASGRGAHEPPPSPPTSQRTEPQPDP